MGKTHKLKVKGQPFNEEKMETEEVKSQEKMETDKNKDKVEFCTMDRSSSLERSRLEDNPIKKRWPRTSYQQ